MMRSFRATRRAAVTLTLLALLPSLALGGGEHGGGHNGSDSPSFGEPAEAAAADRTVTIDANDEMAFSPSTVDVEKGETVRFVVENVGELQHSFTLGTPKGQRQHEEEMKGMAADKMASHMTGDPTGMVIQPGQTRSLTWHFTQARAVQFACHIPGHYPAGMKGKIRIGQ